MRSLAPMNRSSKVSRTSSAPLWAEHGGTRSFRSGCQREHSTSKIESGQPRAKTSATRSDDWRTQMDTDLLDLYERASTWTATKVSGAASQLDAPTTCDDWDVGTLISHMVETQRYFVNSAQGRDAAPPSGTPSPLGDADPVAEFDQARKQTATTFGEPGVIDRTGPALGIAFADQLLHGWDLAASTGQDTTMPDGLADAA